MEARQASRRTLWPFRGMPITALEARPANATMQKVIIIGAGIGGLSLAQGLKRAGIAFAVYERDPSPTSRLQGYRLSLTPDGRSALRSMLADDLWACVDRACTPPIAGISFVSHELESRFFKKTPVSADSINRFCSVSRVTLRTLLLTDLAPHVFFGKRCTGYEMLSIGVRSHFSDSTHADGRLLVGCDGAQSVIRDQLMPSSNKVDTQVWSIAGKVPFDAQTEADFLPPPIGESAVVLDRLPQGMFLASHELEPGGREANYIFWSFLTKRVRLPSDLDVRSAESLIQLTDQMTAGWHPRLKSLIRRTDLQSVLALHFQSSSQPKPWPVGSVTLLGDAVHNMPPTGGEGANMALKDASVLCQELVECKLTKGDLPAAARGYETKMLDYAFSAVNASMKNLDRMVVRE